MTKTLEPFSADWLDAAATAFDGAIDGPLTVVLVVTGGPEGDITTTWTAAASGITAQVGKSTDASITFSIGWADAMAILQGATEPAVAYMQGRLKAAGDMVKVLELFELSASPSFGRWRDRVNAAD